jgi:hypothetical protein
METIKQLMTARHIAFLAALSTGFATGPVTTAWREANRVYVLARDRNPSRTIQHAA